MTAYAVSQRTSRAEPYTELLRVAIGRSRVARASLTNWLMSRGLPEINAVLRIDRQRWRAKLQAQFVALVGAGVALVGSLVLISNRIRPGPLGVVLALARSRLVRALP
jgi:hypothetical protein